MEYLSARSLSRLTLDAALAPGASSRTVSVTGPLWRRRIRARPVPRARSLIRTLPARRDTTAPRDPTALSSGGDWRPEQEGERYGRGGAEAYRTGSSTRSAATAGRSS